jgi:8-oxo-dGTP pyrophosphatase MutT (NUDIX family)
VTPVAIDKVTAFVSRERCGERELLLLAHPYAGIQIPGGTVEAGESPIDAAVREAREESGLARFSDVRCVGCRECTLPVDRRVIVAPATVYARPDATSFHPAHLRRGISVRLLRQEDNFAQIEYVEHDRAPDPTYVTMSIVGWTPASALGDRVRRHFYQLSFAGPSPERWTVRTDDHTFTLFWASLEDLPDIIQPQDEWLAYLQRSPL